MDLVDVTFLSLVALSAVLAVVRSPRLAGAIVLLGQVAGAVLLKTWGILALLGYELVRGSPERALFCFFEAIWWLGLTAAGLWGLFAAAPREELPRLGQAGIPDPGLLRKLAIFVSAIRPANPRVRKALRFAGVGLVLGVTCVRVAQVRDADTFEEAFGISLPQGQQRLSLQSGGIWRDSTVKASFELTAGGCAELERSLACDWSGFEGTRSCSWSRKRRGHAQALLRIQAQRCEVELTSSWEN
jgi:hypothetical protein